MKRKADVFGRSRAKPFGSKNSAVTVTKLWAEAVARYKAGEAWWIDSPDLAVVAAEKQQERHDGDPRQPTTEDWVKGREYVTMAQILGSCLDKQLRDRNQGDKNRVARCLHAIGWTRKR